MEKIKTYFLNNFEQAFILVILVTVVLINYFIPQKLAFLNFYFLPIILAGYYLGLRLSVLGAFLCVALITIYITLYPSLFAMPANRLDLFLHVGAWGGFLILSGTVVGKQQEKLSSEIEQTAKLNEQLQQHQEELKEANLALNKYSKNLEQRVKERTVELEESKEAIESLKVKVEETLYDTMDSSVAKLMIEGRLWNEKRSISVMFSDLVGFTTYSEEKSPELAVRDLNRYLNDMEPILLDFRGHIDKYLGDGIMVEFGAPLDYDNYRLQAVVAAIKMQESMKKIGDHPWEMRIAIASGPAIMGLIGSKHKSYTTIGAVVNLASRMEKTCPPGSIIIDDLTLEGAGNFIEVRPMRSMSLAGNVNIEAEAKLDEFHKRLNHTSDDKEMASLHHEIGKLYMAMNEAHEALKYFEHSLQLQPDNVELKVAYADANMKKEEQEKIRIRGRRSRVSVYEVIGLKDVLADREKIPVTLYDKYHHVLERIDIPEEIILPVEALDGSIGHSKVVALLSYAIASELDIAEQEKTEILNSAFVADIGKEVISHHLLNRRGTLSANELLEVRKHAIEGTRILKAKGYESKYMLKIIRHSHECFNGSGHPDGLEGEEIPIGSRIVKVADSYNALTSWRPYRESIEQVSALDEIKGLTDRGIFDPNIVETLNRLISE